MSKVPIEPLSFLEKHKDVFRKGAGTPPKISKSTYQLYAGAGAHVAARAIQDTPELLHRLTGIRGRVALVSDGSCVKGGGVVGTALFPTLEGVAMLIQELGGVEVVPMVLPRAESEEFAKQVGMLGDSFGAVLLHSIGVQHTLAIEQFYKEHSSTPVFHASKDGMAIVLLASLMNAHIVLKKSLHTSRVAILGTGTEGIGIAQLLMHVGVGDVVLVDRDGVLGSLRSDLKGEKAVLAAQTNRERRSGGVLEAVVGADVLISTVSSFIPYDEYVRMMAQSPVVCITGELPDDVSVAQLHEVGAGVMVTNNTNELNAVHEDIVLPACMRGILQYGHTYVSKTLKVRLAKALAESIAKPTAKKVIPTIFDRTIRKHVLKACEQ